MTARPWTSRDVARLRMCARAGMPSIEAAKRLRRSPGAVRFKAMKLRVRFISLGRAFSDFQRRRWQ